MEQVRSPGASMMERTKVTLFSRPALALLAVFALTLTSVNAGLAQNRAEFCCEPRGVVLDASVTQPYTRQPPKDALRWADAELKRMKLDENTGQLISIGINARFLNEESEEFKELRRQVEQ